MPKASAVQTSEKQMTLTAFEAKWHKQKGTHSYVLN